MSSTECISNTVFVPASKKTKLQFFCHFTDTINFKNEGLQYIQNNNKQNQGNQT